MTDQQLREYEQAVRERAEIRAAYLETLARLRQLCEAAQAVLDGKALHVDSAGDRYVMDHTLTRLETVLARVRAQL